MKPIENNNTLELLTEENFIVKDYKIHVDNSNSLITVEIPCYITKLDTKFNKSVAKVYNYITKHRSGIDAKTGKLIYRKTKYGIKLVGDTSNLVDISNLLSNIDTGTIDLTELNLSNVRKADNFVKYRNKNSIINVSVPTSLNFCLIDLDKAFENCSDAFIHILGPKGFGFNSIFINRIPPENFSKHPDTSVYVVGNRGVNPGSTGLTYDDKKESFRKNLERLTTIQTDLEAFLEEKTIASMMDMEIDSVYSDDDVQCFIYHDANGKAILKIPNTVNNLGISFEFSTNMLLDKLNINELTVMASEENIKGLRIDRLKIQSIKITPNTIISNKGDT